jgi:hypothetical protein
MIYRKMSVAFWVKRLTKALDVAYASPKMKAKLKQLNSQANSIRSWDLGKSATTAKSNLRGFRLLP